MLRYPYQPVPLSGSVPPSLPSTATVRWRPFAPVTITGPAGVPRHFHRALVDPGADDTVFPFELVDRLGVLLRPDTGHRLRWRGQAYPLRYGDAELELSDNETSCRWTTVICFSNAPIPYRILGYAGCLEFFNATFRGADRTVELEPNLSFPGAVTSR
jgi:hypothetical protein